MYKLSLKELEVLKYLVMGFINKQIAEKMCITHYTVKAHISSIMYKLNVTTRTEAAYVAIKNKIIDI